MDGSRFHSSKEAGEQSQDSASVISIEQLQHLVCLLDNSDVSELELRRAGEGTRLVLRKVKRPKAAISPPRMCLLLSAALIALLLRRRPKKQNTKFLRPLLVLSMYGPSPGAEP